MKTKIIILLLILCSIQFVIISKFNVKEILDRTHVSYDTEEEDEYLEYLGSSPETWMIDDLSYPDDIINGINVWYNNEKDESIIECNTYPAESLFSSILMLDSFADCYMYLTNPYESDPILVMEFGVSQSKFNSLNEFELNLLNLAAKELTISRGVIMDNYDKLNIDRCMIIVRSKNDRTNVKVFVADGYNLSDNS